MLRRVMVEELVNLWYALLIQYRVVCYVMRSVEILIKEKVQCVGDNVLKDC